MTVIATCGHCLTEDEGMGQLLALADYDKFGTKSVSYVAYCNLCANEAYTSGSVLLSDEEINEWLGLPRDYAIGSGDVFEEHY